MTGHIEAYSDNPDLTRAFDHPAQPVYRLCGRARAREALGENASPDALRQWSRQDLARESLAHLAEKVKARQLLTPAEKSTWRRFLDWVGDRFGIRLPAGLDRYDPAVADYVHGLLGTARATETTATTPGESRFSLRDSDPAKAKDKAAKGVEGAAAEDNVQNGSGAIPSPEIAFKARTNAQGLTIRAEGVITGPHPKRPKGYRPEPVGGRASGHHRGHLVPENLVDDPKLVNVQENIISEAPRSNLGLKRVFENEAKAIAQQFPNSVVKTVHFPKCRLGQTVPYAVTHYVTVDGKVVKAITIINQ